ncbi:MAG TPA: GNAT family N-acetyltransferase [Candidatus Peribacteraceae bacterium]|nr:GNAT family N-acetyltransferase [Candidatus Peribacteraceae bacterium]
MTPDTRDNLRKRISRAPTDPGVYRWKDKSGEIIYVGKAKNLRNRLRSYVLENAAKGQGPWKQSMYEQIVDFDVTITNTELEALILETNLIKEIRPKYNVLMKDDKNYVYVRITVNDPYPAVDVVRKMEFASDNLRSGPSERPAGRAGKTGGVRYFGPFLSRYETEKTLDMLHDFVGFRACRDSIDAMNRWMKDQEAPHPTESGKLRPCLDFQIHQCNGLCAGDLSVEEYRRRIDQVIEFFKGDYDPVINAGKERMMQLAADKKFERAGEIRDTLQMIEHMKERQLISDTSGDDTDVVGVAVLSGKAHVEILQKRLGKLTGEHHLSLMGKAESVADVLEQFLPQYYEGVADIPETVLVSEDFSDRETLETFLTDQHGKKVRVIVPERGKKSKLLELAEKNAQQKAMQAEASWEAEERNIQNALDELASNLDLATLPKRIEGYDISHTGGTETVGSMVVFVNGKPKNDQYRSFTIHSMQRGAIDDYRALKEVLARRLRHAAGGLKMEEKKWEENGITIGKARKNEQTIIEGIIERHPTELSQQPIDYHEFWVARCESDIIGMGCLHKHATGLLELKSIWINEEHRGGRLGQFLSRFILKSVKKGKVYVMIDPQLEQYYASVGFRHVLKAPPVLIEEMQSEKKKNPSIPDGIVLVYDTTQHKTDGSLATFPDLLVIDGGKGQLNAVHEVLQSFGLSIPVIGLAKREEEVFVPGKKDPVIFRTDSPAKFMLMRLRDEAHRFANRHRKKRAAKHAVQSQLDHVPGIGPDTKQELLKTFGSVDVIRRQDDAALKNILNEEQIHALRQVL